MAPVIRHAIPNRAIMKQRGSLGSRTDYLLSLNESHGAKPQGFLHRRGDRCTSSPGGPSLGAAAGDLRVLQGGPGAVGTGHRAALSHPKHAAYPVNRGFSKIGDEFLPCCRRLHATGVTLGSPVLRCLWKVAWLLVHEEPRQRPYPWRDRRIAVGKNLAAVQSRKVPSPRYVEAISLPWLNEPAEEKEDIPRPDTHIP